MIKLLKTILRKHFSSLSYFYRYLRYRLFVVIFLSVVIGSLDAFGLTMFFPLLQLANGNSITSGDDLGNLGFLVDFINAVGLELNLEVALFFLFVFFMLKGGVNYLVGIIKVKVNQYFASQIRLKLTNLFSRFSFKQFVISDVGKIQNSFTGEIVKVTSAYNSYSNCMQQIIMTIVYLFFVFYVDWKFALLVCLGGSISNLLYSSIYKKTKKHSIGLTKINGNYQGLIIQYVNNFKYLKATGRLNEYSEKLKKSIADIEITHKKIGILNSKVSSSREPLLITVVCCVIFIQVYFLKGNLTAVLVSLLFFYRALTSLMSFQNYYNSFLGVSGSLDSIAFFEEELRNGIETNGTKHIQSFEEAIKLENVNFGYHNYQILKNVNLSISKNHTVAFIGESGSGKTTLINLISGLLKPEKGRILIDQHDLNELEISSYQNRIGYIAQESVIFNDTIFNNVTFWAEPTPENIQRFKEAVRKASISDFIEGLEKKEDTLLGNNGINLSGGQKQRISIARELYKDIDILILDEATSALDSETEKEIQENIDRLKGKYTVLIIAHRFSTIKNADIIYLMDKGQIVGQGNFEGLIKTSDRFKRMVELQEI